MSVVQQAVLMVGLCLTALFAQAQEANANSAHQVVREATTQVMAVLEEATTYAEDDPERYFTAVHGILDPIIDYRGFARGVMGEYASRERYQSLDAEGREQLRRQLELFTETMRQGLIRTYSKGLLAFGGSQVEINDPPPDAETKGVVSVEQLIFNDEPQPYVVLYQMGRNSEGQWKLRNVIIEAINLGQVYRNQFEALARKHDGDLDSVISEWTIPDTQENES